MVTLDMMVIWVIVGGTDFKHGSSPLGGGCVCVHARARTGGRNLVDELAMSCHALCRNGQR